MAVLPVEKTEKGEHLPFNGFFLLISHVPSTGKMAAVIYVTKAKAWHKVRKDAAPQPYQGHIADKTLCLS
jgi:hypothetical protein